MRTSICLPMVLLMLGVSQPGCRTNQLETGYTYTPLGDSPARRRGYYADPFSPEARAAQVSGATESEARRPIPGQ
jgi:hypothetical protein